MVEVQQPGPDGASSDNWNEAVDRDDNGRDGSQINRYLR